MTAEIDVLVLGGAGVDTIVHVPELPVPLADSHVIRPGIVTRAGQSGDFVALGTSALGLRTHHLDLIGDDHEGDLVRAPHRDHGIALTAVPQPCGTKRAVNRSAPTAEGSPRTTRPAGPRRTGCPRRRCASRPPSDRRHCSPESPGPSPGRSAACDAAHARQREDSEADEGGRGADQFWGRVHGTSTERQRTGKRPGQRTTLGHTGMEVPRPAESAVRSPGDFTRRAEAVWMPYGCGVVVGRPLVRRLTILCCVQIDRRAQTDSDRARAAQ